MMKSIYLNFLFFIFLTSVAVSQTSTNYSISFENAVHHEAKIEVIFSKIESDILEVRMSRSSPGRYALHEFAKNVYEVKAFDSKGNILPVTRPNPFQWNIAKHDGTVKITYVLFGNRADGTYTQIDETHAHLNMPATFMYANSHKNRPVTINFKVREDLTWKIASQLKPEGNRTYSAPNFYYFMDSPTEISNHAVKRFKITSGGKEQTINFALHDAVTDAQFNYYFNQVKSIVDQEIKVFGELPNFDFGEYTFIACYTPNASGDGMEHRNSTILTSPRSLSHGGMKENIGTVAHEFFHAWNVERIRPKSLEPFDFSTANMSGELWFAEGFTEYYSNLILCRAGIISQNEYLQGLAYEMNYVWNSPARKYFNPIEMSYQAPFVDAATSVDPVNRENTFISYYTYGSVLGLALDLSLRDLNTDKNLDGFMQLVWQTNGKSELPYTLEDLQKLLEDYAGKDFSETFFNKFIYASEMPDYSKFFENMGIVMQQSKTNQAYFGAKIYNENGKWLIYSNPAKESAAYLAGMSFGDQIIEINNIAITETTKMGELFSQFKPNQTVNIKYIRYGLNQETDLTFGANPAYDIAIMENATKKMIAKRNNWLH